MHYQWLFQAYIIYTLYRIPQKFKNFKFFQNFIKLKNLIFFFKNLTFQNFIKFQKKKKKKLKFFIKYMHYQRHGWNIWYNEHYMSKSTYILYTGGPWGDIGFSGWYGMWYRFWHLIFSIYYPKKRICTETKPRWNSYFSRL